MKNTGALLKAKRESSSLSLSEVALATKINPKILAAIENGDETSLPAKTILKGFLRSYALFLKMDVDEVLRTFQEESGPPPTPPSQIAQEATKPEPTSVSRRRVNDESSSGMRTLAVVVIVVLIGLIIGVRELVEKYQREKVVEQPVDLKAQPIADVPDKPVAGETTTEVKDDSADETPAAGEAAPAPAPAPAPTTGMAAPLGGTTPPPAEKPAEKPPEPAAAAPTNTTAPAVAGPSAPIGILAPAVPPAPTAATPPPPPPKPEPAAATPPPPEEKKPAAKAAKHEIILEALDKVEVKFQVKGETKRVSLGATQVHTIHSDQPLTIDLSDGGAVNVILDGRERGVPGDLGKPKTIKIP